MMMLMEEYSKGHGNRLLLEKGWLLWQMPRYEFTCYAPWEYDHPMERWP